MNKHHFIAINTLGWATGNVIQVALSRLQIESGDSKLEVQVWDIPLSIDEEYYIGIYRPQVKGAKEVYVQLSTT